jgi:hypothetical protein
MKHGFANALVVSLLFPHCSLLLRLVIENDNPGNSIGSVD